MDFFDGPAAADTKSTPTSSNPPAGGNLPSRSDIKTQEQLMADSIAAIEERGQAKFEQMKEESKKRTQADDAKNHDAEEKMRADAAKELRSHVTARDEAVAAAKATHKEAQKKLLSETAKLQEKGSAWELAATHCDLSKPNSRATKSTDRMRKMLHSLTTEPNVPIGTESS